jgi:hypothetical protein
VAAALPGVPVACLQADVQGGGTVPMAGNARARGRTLREPWGWPGWYWAWGHYVPQGAGRECGAPPWWQVDVQVQCGPPLVAGAGW